MRLFQGVLVGFLSVMSCQVSASEKHHEYLIKLNQGKTLNGPMVKSLKAKVKQNLQLLSGQFVLVSSPLTKKEMDQKINQDKNIAYVALNEPLSIPDFQIHQTSNQDEKFDLMWGLLNLGRNKPNRDGSLSNERGVVGADIDAIKAWDSHQDNYSVTVAVIDTGIDYNHPDLKDNRWVNSQEIPNNNLDDDQNGVIDDVYGASFTEAEPSGNVFDDNGHGTHCAGTIGAVHNQIGVAGVMKKVKLLGVKFLNSLGSGSIAGAIQAIDYATRMKVDIMSNSWGGGGFNQALEDVIRKAHESGIVFVAAAGNSATNNDTKPTYPANYSVPNVISVAAHTHKDTLADFSCYGEKTVHLAAPGDRIYSTTPRNSYAVFSGTSMATPHVAGAIGLLIAQEGRLSMEEIKQRLIKTTTPVTNYAKKVISMGRLNAFNLLTNHQPERE